jgi:putative hemolysin
MLVLVGEILIVMALVLANGALAGSEIALLSAGKGRLRSRARAGDLDAGIALELVEAPNRLLSTVQIGITLVGITAGAFGAAALSGNLTDFFTSLGLAPGRANLLAFAAVVAAITFVSLVFGELVPKRVALGDPEGISVRVARPMRLLARLSTPLVYVLSMSTELILKLLRWRPAMQPSVSAEEIERLVAEATASGILEKTEQDVVRRLFRLSDLTVETLMTPRERIVWLNMGAPPSKRRGAMMGVGHSRFIVGDGELDSVRGYAKVQDLLEQCLRGEEPDPRAVLRQPHVVPPWTPAFHVLERFRESGDHIAIVQHASGRVMGLVTLNDVLENIVGEFPEPHEMAVPTAVRRPDGSWLMDGLLPLEEALRGMHVQLEAAGGFPTLHSFVVHHLGEEPSAADRFEWRGLSFEVVDMDGSRVDKVLVQPLPAVGEGSGGARSPAS